jgi:Rieske Fe-S protein
MTQVSRRTVTGLATAGLSLPLLAACGDDGDTAGDPGGSSSPSGSTTPTQGTSPTAGESPSGGGSADALASTSDIEVGGGTIFADEKVVVTQPTEGEFKAFSSTCTHQGCQVESVSDGTINCPCHGSKFSIEDGAPDAGPATSPLEEVAITVDGDSIVLA